MIFVDSIAQSGAEHNREKWIFHRRKQMTKPLQAKQKTAIMMKTQQPENREKWEKTDMGKSIKIGNLTLGEGIPKICVPIVGETREEVLQSAEMVTEHRPDIIEWRMDYLPNALQMEETAALLKELKILCREIPLLATFRTKKEGGCRKISEKDYMDLYVQILETHLADAIDVEAFFAEDILKYLSGKAHEYGAKVIASNHDFTATPPRQEIENRLRFMQEAGADVAKIAVMPRNQADVLTLLAATEAVTAEEKIPVISMAMGKMGMVSRLLGENFGSCLTFAMVGKASAPGQIPIRQLRTFLEMIHQYNCS